MTEPAIDIGETLGWACDECDVCDGHGMLWDGVAERVGLSPRGVALCPRCILPKLAELQRTRPRLAEALQEVMVLRDQTGIDTLRAGLREAATTIAKLQAEKRALTDALEAAESALLLLTRLGQTEVDRV